MDARKKIEEVLEGIRPALRVDGGDVELVAYDEGRGIVQVCLLGACTSCPISLMTLRQGIERRIKSVVPEVTEVQAV